MEVTMKLVRDFDHLMRSIKASHRRALLRLKPLEKIRLFYLGIGGRSLLLETLHDQSRKSQSHEEVGARVCTRDCFREAKKWGSKETYLRNHKSTKMLSPHIRLVSSFLGELYQGYIVGLSLFHKHNKCILCKSFYSFHLTVHLVYRISSYTQIGNLWPTDPTNQAIRLSSQISDVCDDLVEGTVYRNSVEASTVQGVALGGEAVALWWQRRLASSEVVDHLQRQVY